MTGAVTIEDVSFSRRLGRRGSLEVLDSISIEAEVGETVAIVGPNGCGKTTLLEILCGFIEPSSGTVSCEPVALMPQREALLPWAGALDNAALSLRARGASRADARKKASEWFPRLGLAGFEDVRPDSLSGGMRQRVSFARTLLSGRPVLALDEPFSALDALSRIEAREWLSQALAETGRTALIVTHDAEEAALIADRVVIFGPRPARVLAVLEGVAADARVRSAPEVIAMREAILELLGVAPC